MLIGIAGAAGVGKDTLSNSIMMHDASYIKMSLAYPIKEMLCPLFGVPIGKWEDSNWKETEDTFLEFSPRQAAQKLGTEWRDIMDPTGMMWCNLLTARSMDIEKTIVTDIRFGHEQEWVRNHDGIIVYLTREGVTPVAEHISENSLNMQMVDIHISNDGTPEEMLAQLIRFYGDKL